MDTQIVAVFWLSDDMLKALYYYENPQCERSDAEMITTAIVPVLQYRGNFELSRKFLLEEGYIPKILGRTWKDLNMHSICAIDSYLIAARENYRICRSERYQ
jgi:hypothetical protein